MASRVPPPPSTGAYLFVTRWKRSVPPKSPECVDALFLKIGEDDDLSGLAGRFGGPGGTQVQIEIVEEEAVLAGLSVEHLALTWDSDGGWDVVA
jgi:hypothetical protein